MADVTVEDRIRVTCRVTPDQALRFCRRVLPGWTERAERRGSEGVISVSFDGAASGFVRVCIREDYADYGVRMAELCNDLAAWGIVSQPSEALRAMAAESP
jgi:hypothetical protein